MTGCPSRRRGPLAVSASLVLGVSACAAGALAVEAPPRLELRLYGHAQVDYVQAFQGVDPNWLAAVRPSYIVTDPSVYGTSPQATLSVRQSRFGIAAQLPLGGEALQAHFEFDLFGVGVDAGQTTMRLRHVFGEWRWLLAGQTNSVFMDGDMFPNIIEYWGPAGMILYRNPQIRLTPIAGEHELAVAAERPGTSLDAGTSGASWVSQSSMPDFTAHYRHQLPFAHFQLGGLMRDLGYQSGSGAVVTSEGHALGAGANASAHLDFAARQGFPHLTLRMSTTYGHGIANYMNDGGVDLAPDVLGRAQAVPLLGVMGFVELYATPRWAGTVGYSSTAVQTQEGQAPTAFLRGDYASATVLFTPVENLLVGAGYNWARRQDADGGSGVDQRAQLTVKYSYSFTFHP
jgi:hypothetical protein